MLSEQIDVTRLAQLEPNAVVDRVAQLLPQDFFRRVARQLQQVHARARRRQAVVVRMDRDLMNRDGRTKHAETEQRRPTTRRHKFQ